ncbi:MAG: fluoride efflux transporter CrcB [Syntrophobacteraceae bacterium]|jgi:CrcB protein|nr:fluoride efflux transporter CrcB [Syntrophobacteraceae bacterium]
MTKILLVMLGGGLGAASRYTVGLLAASLLGTRFPWGTLVVNLVGCFLIGLSCNMARRALPLISPDAYVFFVTGYLGAFTTFSTFALETSRSLREGAAVQSVASVLLNNVLGVVLCCLGMWIGGPWL